MSSICIMIKNSGVVGIVAPAICYVLPPFCVGGISS
jgi:hypothetical protein